LSNSVIAETNDAGTYLYYYVYGPTGLLYRQSASTGGVESYHFDFRGSTIATTNINQNIIRQYQYDAYGKILQRNAPPATDDNPFRYVGQYGVQYEEQNLYFMRARYYDPTTGKFLSEDPIWSTNLFAYGDNNPVNMIDFTGGTAYSPPICSYAQNNLQNFQNEMNGSAYDIGAIIQIGIAGSALSWKLATVQLIKGYSNLYIYQTYVSPILDIIDLTKVIIKNDKKETIEAAIGILIDTAIKKIGLDYLTDARWNQNALNTTKKFLIGQLTEAVKSNIATSTTEDALKMK
jgi:RHS repeat-associated protein